MATQVQLRRGTAAENNAFTGAQGEVTVDTTNDTLRVHDNSQAGGYEIAKSDSQAHTNVDINSGTIDDTTIGGSTPAAGSFTGLTLTGDATFGDDDKAIFGAGSDLQIYHDGVGGESIIHDAGTGNLKIRATNFVVTNSGNSQNIIRGFDGGDVELYYAGSEKLATTATGIDVTGTVTSDGLTVAGNVSVDGGTIKLDGNYPVGTNNVALGDAALDDGSLTGGNNTAVGTEALTDNTSGAENVAVGHKALFDNTTGSNNTALGRNALRLNSTASNNTAVGYAALDANTTGTTNVAVGTNALDANTTASENTAVGRNALTSVTTGGANTAVGERAGNSVTTGVINTFVGQAAGRDTTGSRNTFIGCSAGLDVTTGEKNTIIGRYGGNQGGLDIRTSSNNIVLSDGDGNPRGYYSNGAWRFVSPRGSSLSASTFFFDVTGANPQGLQILFSDASDDDGVEDFFACIDSTTTRLLINNQGDVQNHDNSYGGISDERLKEQIIDASSQWDDIKSLTVRKFKFKSDVAEKGDSDEHWRLGVIAQEVEAAGMSGLVKTKSDMIENEDGEVVESGEYTKSVKYSILYMKAVKALQEAMDRIETLEAKVTALESN